MKCIVNVGLVTRMWPSRHAVFYIMSLAQGRWHGGSEWRSSWCQNKVQTPVIQHPQSLREVYLFCQALCRGECHDRCDLTCISCVDLNGKRCSVCSPGQKCYTSSKYISLYGLLLFHVPFYHAFKHNIVKWLTRQIQTDIFCMSTTARQVDYTISPVIFCVWFSLWKKAFVFVRWLQSDFKEFVHFRNKIPW